MRKGVTEYTIILNEIVKSLPRSRGKVISPKISEVAYIVNNNTMKVLTPTKMENTVDNSVFVKINDPATAEIETRIINGNKKLSLITFTFLFSESIVSHAFTGLRIMFFNPIKKNL